MQTGDLIGRGRTAEVYAHDHDRVVKLLRPGFDPAALALEARKTQTAHDAGVSAPSTYGPVTIDGRSGYVFDRVNGALMLDVITSRPWRYRRYSHLLVDVHVDMHTRPGNGLPDVKERLASRIDRAPLDALARRVAKDRLLSLDHGDRVLHGDFHPGNIVLSDAGPVVIDWLDAARGSPAADVARSLWLFSPPTIEPGARFRSLLSFYVDVLRRRYLRRYLAAADVDPIQIHLWRLPVLVGRLTEGIEYEMQPLESEIHKLVRDDRA